MRKGYAIFAVIIAAIFISNEIFGITGSDAVSSVLKENLYLKKINYDIKIADDNYKLAKSELLPKLYADEIYMSSDRPMYAFGNILNQGRFSQSVNFNDPGRQENFNTSFTAEMPIYVQGKIHRAIKQAKIYREINKKNLENAENSLLSGVIQILLNIEKTKDMESSLDKSITSIEGHITNAEHMFKQGLIIESDLLSLMARKEEILHMKQRVLANRNILKSKLAMMLNMDGVPETVNSSKDIFKFKDITIEDAVKEALKNRAENRLVYLKKQIIEQEYKKSKEARLPAIFAKASYDYDDENFGTDKNSSTYMVYGRLPIFEFGRIQNNINKQKHLLDQTDIEIDMVKRKIEQETREAYYKYQEAVSKLNHSKKSFEAAEESYRIVKLRYENKTATVTDLLDAEARLTDARNNMTSDKLDITIQRVIVEEKTGKLKNTLIKENYLKMEE